MKQKFCEAFSYKNIYNFTKLYSLFKPFYLKFLLYVNF